MVHETAAQTLYDLIKSGSDDSTALSAPGGVALTFAALRALVDRTIGGLNSSGIGRGDRVAIVVHNGPEMAAAFIAIAAGTTAAPLNPAYTAEELEFYMSDLQAKLLVVVEGDQSPAIAVAGKLDVPVVRLVPMPEDGAGSFALAFPEVRKAPASAGGPAAPDDLALVLHTSGTTSRPKIVPLRQSNVCASARNIRSSLAFTAADRGLNIMPLFHIHGLIAGILAPLSAGGQVSCTPGFNALKFFGWMSEVRPTWYTAVPTMHQAILARASRNTDVIKANPLRFIRSSSSSMPPQVMRALEDAFGAPLIEVRGDNVMSGYENNPDANATAFTRHGWFRTGDQGTLTEDGYLAITGRLKEIINRGGEKISPREVDEIIMDHPAISQCVTFAVPHDKLGEDVAAAVVLRDGAAADAKELRGFVAQHLAPFKVPTTILILDEIPKGATGKLQRIGLARKLGLG